MWRSSEIKFYKYYYNLLYIHKNIHTYNDKLIQKFADILNICAFMILKVTSSIINLIQMEF